MNARRASLLIGLGTFLVFGLMFVALFFGKLSPDAIFPLFVGLMVVSVASRIVLAALQAKPSLDRIMAALSGDKDPALGLEWQRGADADGARALRVFTCDRLPSEAPLVGSSTGMPARVSYEKFKGDNGGTYLLTFASVDAAPSGHKVVVMRGPRRPWQALSSDVVEAADAPVALGGGWRVAASDPSAVDLVISHDVAQALAQSRRSVAAAVWADGEVTVVEDGNRTSATRVAEMLRLAVLLSGRVAV